MGHYKKLKIAMVDTLLSTYLWRNLTSNLGTLMAIFVGSYHQGVQRCVWTDNSDPAYYKEVFWIE